MERPQNLKMWHKSNNNRQCGHYKFSWEGFEDMKFLCRRVHHLTELGLAVSIRLGGWIILLEGSIAHLMGVELLPPHPRIDRKDLPYNRWKYYMLVLLLGRGRNCSACLNHVMHKKKNEKHDSFCSE